MAQLVATSVAMVDAPVSRVRDAIRDYLDARPAMLTPEFSGYEVLNGGLGAGTEVCWRLALEEAIRNRKGKRPRPPKHPPREFLIHVEEPSDRVLLERDTRSTLVTEWTLRPAESRTAVRVRATWDHTGRIWARQSEQLAMRTVLEELLTGLHGYFAERSAEPGD